MLLALCPRLCPRWPILGTPCLGQTFSFPAFTTTFVVKKSWGGGLLWFCSTFLQEASTVANLSLPMQRAGSSFANCHPASKTQFLLHPVCFGLVEIESLTSYRKDKKKYLCPKRAIIAFFVFNRLTFDWTSIQSKDSKLFCSQENLRNCKFPPDNTK